MSFEVDFKRKILHDNLHLFFSLSKGKKSVIRFRKNLVYLEDDILLVHHLTL